MLLAKRLGHRVDLKFSWNFEKKEMRTSDQRAFFVLLASRMFFLCICFAAGGLEDGLRLTGEN